MSEIRNMEQATEIIESIWATDRERFEAHAYRLKQNDCPKYIAEALAELCGVAARDIDRRDNQSWLRGFGV